MTEAEFNRLVEQYLDRSATAAEVARLREGLLGSPELQQRFRQREKLYQAQVKCLAEVGHSGQTWVRAWLLGFAQRFNRYATGLCLLAMVLVQTRVTLDTDYRGLNLYVLDGIKSNEVFNVPSWFSD